VEPDFCTGQVKKLAGGGYFKIANQSIEPALKNLGYTPHKSKRFTTCLERSPLRALRTSIRSTKGEGFTDEELAKIEGMPASVFELAFAFSPGHSGKRR